MTVESTILPAHLHLVRAAYPMRAALDGTHPDRLTVLREDRPVAPRRWSGVAQRLAEPSSLEALLADLLDIAMALSNADFGNVQLCDRVTRGLRIVAHSGFSPEFLDHFAVVDDTATACGRAFATRASVVLADTLQDPSFAPHAAIAEAIGFRGVQSTPLQTHSGKLLGVVSVHFEAPHTPSDSELELLELFADIAGEAVAGQLGSARPTPTIGNRKAIDAQSVSEWITGAELPDPRLL